MSPVIMKIGYRNHTEPLFKSKQILKIVDDFKVQASLLMYDFNHKKNKKTTTDNCTMERQDSP